LLCADGILGLCPTRGGVFVPFPFVLGRLLFERDFAEVNVVGGDVVRSKKELKVEVLLLPLLPARSCGSSFPSLLEVLPEECCVSAVWMEALERRRKLKSLRNEGITTRIVGQMGCDHFVRLLLSPPVKSNTVNGSNECVVGERHWLGGR
jgi:hypothetical protein